MRPFLLYRLNLTCKKPSLAWWQQSPSELAESFLLNPKLISPSAEITMTRLENIIQTLSLRLRSCPIHRLQPRPCLLGGVAVSCSWFCHASKQVAPFYSFQTKRLTTNTNTSVTASPLILIRVTLPSGHCLTVANPLASVKDKWPRSAGDII
jgi:hypothetical protein